ncbi:Uncharacterised protein [Trueperella pyogenes]|uniref:hypothetical protein n=1 Tax=Trueperella pyogenes TaxID=1661 RepID=UPI000E020E48|nr:hypothetical protein [Trueperella pyogenes]SUP61689.1 Uncharacterised protein [Trueperella pyogenes]
MQWALATTKDAELYVGDASATKVVGLEAWDKAKVETLQGTEEARKAIEQAGHSDTGLDITHSDLWLKAGSGEKSVTAELTPDVTFEQSLIATTSTGTAPDLTLQWTRTVGVANPVPVIAMGVLIALIGTLLILNARQASKVRMSARRIRARRERSEAETSILPKYDDRADTNATTGGAYGAAIVPAPTRNCVSVPSLKPAISGSPPGCANAVARARRPTPHRRSTAPASWSPRLGSARWHPEDRRPLKTRHATDSGLQRGRCGKSGRRRRHATRGFGVREIAGVAGTSTMRVSCPGRTWSASSPGMPQKQR